MSPRTTALIDGSNVNTLNETKKENKLKATSTAKSIAVGIALTATITVGAILGTPGSAHADELSDAASTVENSQREYDDAVSKQNDLAQQIADIENKLPAQQEAADKAVRSMYTSGNDTKTIIELLTSSQSISDMINKIDYYTCITAQRQQAITTANASLTELRKAKEKQDEAVNTAESAKASAQDAYNKAQQAAAARTKTTNVKAAATDEPQENDTWNTGYMTVSQLKFRGVVRDNGYRYTYYSESVLPGPGLNIPGRHHANGCVVDGDGYICVASSDLARGTVVPTPLGDGKVYDSGCASGTIDIYIA